MTYTQTPHKKKPPIVSYDGADSEGLAVVADIVLEQSQGRVHLVAHTESTPHARKEREKQEHEDTHTRRHQQGETSAPTP